MSAARSSSTSNASLPPFMSATGPTSPAMSGVIFDCSTTPLARRHPHEHLGAFAGRQPHAVERHRRLEQPAVGRDEVDRSSVAPGERVGACRGCVEDSQADELVGDVEVWAARPVDDELVAEAAGVAALRALALALGREAAVLHDHGHVVDAVLTRQPERALVLVVQDEHAREPARDVLLGLAVRVRVVPERRGLLVDVPFGRPCSARVDHLVRAAVHLGGKVHAVPVHGRGLVERVGHVDPHALATVGDERRPEVAAVESPGVARDARLELRRSRPRVEREDSGAVGVDRRFGERRDRERPVELDVTDRGDRSGAHDAAAGEGEGDEPAGGDGPECRGDGRPWSA